MEDKGLENLIYFCNHGYYPEEDEMEFFFNFELYIYPKGFVDVDMFIADHPII